MNGDVSGILLIDKPAGLTSHQVVERIRRILKTQKVGHTGTLDPGATGLLVVCVGKALKLIEFMEPLSKEYLVTVRLGILTDTLDASGKTLAETPVPPLAKEQILDTLKRFEGEMMQQPPAISAIKVGGRRSYTLARMGMEVLPPPRQIRIHTLHLLEWASPRLTLVMSCSKGTYVRSLARDLGEALGCGGIVETLRRTAVGNFTEDRAIPIEGADQDRLKAALLDMECGLEHLPVVEVDEASARDFCQGKSIPRPGDAPACAGTASPFAKASGDRPAGRPGVVRVHYGRTFLGVGETSAGGLLKPQKVLSAVNPVDPTQFPKMI